MKAYLRKAVIQYAQKRKIDDKYKFGSNRTLYQDRFRGQKYCPKTKLLTKEGQIVPASDTLHADLRKAHLSTGEHIKDSRTLVGKLLKKNYFLPDFIVGLLLPAKESYDHKQKSVFC